MKYLVAVSGGVDSVVLLDMLAAEKEHDITVAHFNHGIRDDSADDARFVEGLAKLRGFPFVTKREDLGKAASEEIARTRRYAFLRAEAKARGAAIATAHHQDDLIESIAINLVRGTGWRGAAVLSAPDLVRPLLHMTKQEIRAYAADRRLEWTEDSTNASARYLRNRLRHRLTWLNDTERAKLQAIWQRQTVLRREIEAEAARLLDQAPYPRYLLIHTEPAAATELLRAICRRENVTAPTRPQLERALMAIKTARGGSTYEMGGGLTMRFTTRSFIVTTP